MRTLLMTEAKLFLRTPLWAVLGVFLPTAVLLGVGSIPGMREPSPVTSGYRFVDLWVPSLVVIALAMLGLQVIPAAVATYREQGILRRLATTPVPPAYLLLAQVLIHAAVALAGVALMLVTAKIAFDVPIPRHPGLFLLALLLGLVSIFALGLIAASLARTGKAAGGLAMIAFFPVMFLGGVYLPRPLLPPVLQKIGAYVPPGTQSLQDAWVGNGGQPLQFAALAAFALGGTALAVRLFRWE
ncbi:ABC transporter permease [Amycolatopsis echigonensis]|uniref:Transport permease protein n=1 Tax=Amycolatopsis echigonensis TaxID=2576905 RepID=A0A2N3WGG4_9PSEU|nr:MULTISPECIES: ABC transporter permease [Amycolatopsis]MBB2498028.1 ABC transporter permease [Amycolatopsis echigonensis]PKV92953.1 ABC-2 type transport system permease protein [Amycolatopsis niigatensis]